MSVFVYSDKSSVFSTAIDCLKKHFGGTVGNLDSKHTKLQQYYNDMSQQHSKYYNDVVSAVAVLSLSRH